MFPDIVLITFVAGYERNQIITWGFKCFKTSRKQVFTLVSIWMKGLYGDLSVLRLS